MPDPTDENPWLRSTPPASAVPERPTTSAAGPEDAPRASRPKRRTRERVLALIAELLILSGLATGAYVLWTAWWTDVVAVHHQAAVLAQLHQPSTPDRAGVERRGPAPVLDEPPGIGDVFGSMQIPRFGTDYDRPIAQGTDRERVLNTIGLGHYIGAAMPGAEGNFAVAGHRVTYGKPLNQIAEMQNGDAIVVRVTDPRVDFDVWYVYKTTDSEIVTPDKVGTIAPVPNDIGAAPSEDDRWLTLTACHPMWSAAERYVVHAKLDYWMQAADGTPAELTEAH